MDELKIEEEPDRWRCLSSGDAPKLLDPVRYEAPVLSVGTDRPVTDAVAHFCAKADEICATPTLPAVSPSSDGVMRFEISGLFDGYVKLESETMVPAIVELSRPIGSMRELPELRMVDPVLLELFASQMKASIDPELGHALFWAVDCDGKRTEGVTVKAQLDALAEPDQSIGYYVVTGLPSITRGETADAGGGGFINLPTTIVTFEARRAATDELISTFSARIRRGHTTLFVIEPD